ncbi:DUF885 domain-containing protein [Alteromonas lipolytica]|uniref:DUF885 domain-containing protein n=1 Tax=Alteromonas lipolytica TaxID=1856405 RepID=A0A1E8F8E3_9ALTE|nr:DUF885 domain-containing protein [Alteromonas lipolytica]OFI32187.1 hypothetical protein BFC17_08155 [Alteromonas lipolytica]GGF83188.1 hypothetical protein GCM10011338_39360 [Alteromonas lipolytica]
MKRLFILSAVALALSACSEAPQTNSTTQPASVAETAQVSESERLNAWFEEKYEEQLQFSPLMMTRLGRKDLYDQIDDMSEQAQDKRLAWMAGTVDELKANFDYSKLDEETKISYDIWMFQFEQAKKQAEFRRRNYVLTQMNGMQSMLPTLLINYHKVAEASDVDAYISRLKGVGKAVEQLTNQVAINADEGVKAPYFAYEGVIKQSKAIISGKPFNPNSDKDSSLLADVKAKIAALQSAGDITAEQAAAYITDAEAALVEDVMPAYGKLISWFENDLPNISRDAKGAWSLPQGEAYYNAALALRTTTDLTADEIHQIGLNEVERILGEMEKIKQAEGFDGTLKEFFAYIKSDNTDERFYYPNTDEGRQAYLDDATRFLDNIAAKLPDFFGILPKADLVVKRVEPYREQAGAPQHYFAGSPDGSTPGVYYAHLIDMTTMPKNEMEAIAYHEGNPGHHMQISIAQELQGVPKFRTTSFFNSYVEGWALYAESVAKEMGGYQNPMSDFGRLVSEMWRAIRLVVDTGIHAKGWTEEEANQFFRDNSPVSDGAIKTEVQRYFVWPGQATSYKIGMLKILELRAKAEAELGEKFDIRDFHDVVLGSGAVPLAILERMVDNWIAKEKAA